MGNFIDWLYNVEYFELKNTCMDSSTENAILKCSFWNGRNCDAFKGSRVTSVLTNTLRILNLSWWKFPVSFPPRFVSRSIFCTSPTKHVHTSELLDKNCNCRQRDTAVPETHADKRRRLGHVSISLSLPHFYFSLPPSPSLPLSHHLPQGRRGQWNIGGTVPLLRGSGVEQRPFWGLPVSVLLHWGVSHERSWARCPWRPVSS